MPDLFEAVQRLAANSPYAVERTGDGFDVRLDLVDAQWHTLFATQHLDRTFIHHVRLRQEAATYAITDEHRQVSWSKLGHGGRAPMIGAAMSRQRGTIHQRGMGQIWAWDDQGQRGKVVDYSFSSEEGRALIRKAAAECGMTETMNPTTRMAVIVGISGALLALAVVIAAVVVLLAR